MLKNNFSIHLIASFVTLFIHYTLGVFLSIGFVVLYTMMKWDLRFASLQMIFLIFFPLYGAYMTIVSSCCYFFLSITQKKTDLLEALVPQVENNFVRDIYERIEYGLDRAGQDKTPLPFMDVMSFGTSKEKRKAIEKMLRYYQPKFSFALKKGLSDKNNGIRVLAATAMAALEKKYFERYVELEKMYRLLSDDPKRLKDLALFVVEYAESGILDEERKNKMQHQGIELWLKHKTLCKVDAERDLNLAKLYLKLNLPKLALEHLTLKGEEERLLEMQAQFALKNYSKVRELGAWKVQTSV